MVLDDAHWFDEVSARVMAMAGRRLDVATVRLIAVCRNEFPSPLADGGWPQMVVGPLDAEQSGSFLDELGVDLSPPAVQRCSSRPPATRWRWPNCPGWPREHLDPRRRVAADAAPDRGLRRQAAKPRRASPEGVASGALDGVATGAVGSAQGRSRYVMRGWRPPWSTACWWSTAAVKWHSGIPWRVPRWIQASTANQRRGAHALLAGLYPDDVVRRAAHLANATVDPDQAVADTLAEAAELTIRRGGARQAVELLRRAAELSKRPRRREELLADAAYVASQAAELDEAERLLDDAGLGGHASTTALLTSSYVALYRDGEVTATHRRLVERLRSPEDLDSETLTRVVNLLLAVSLYAGDPVHWGITDTLVDSLAGRLGELTLIYRDAWADAGHRGASVGQRLNAQLNRLPELEPWDVMRLGVAGYFVDMLDDFRLALARMVDRELYSGAATNAMVMLHLIMLDQLARGQWVEACTPASAGWRYALSTATTCSAISSKSIWACSRPAAATWCGRASSPPRYEHGRSHDRWDSLWGMPSRSRSCAGWPKPITKRPTCRPLPSPASASSRRTRTSPPGPCSISSRPPFTPIA